MYLFIDNSPTKKTFEEIKEMNLFVIDDSLWLKINNVDAMQLFSENTGYPRYTKSNRTHPFNKKEIVVGVKSIIIKTE